MPWPNLTPQELAAYQMLSGNPQMGQAQGMNPQMQAYMAMMAQQQNPAIGQMNPQMGMQQPTMANMLAARPNSSGGMMNLPTTPGYTPANSNMSTILNNPQLMQFLMRSYGGGAT